MKFAPLVLLVYNRTWHTKKTLDALALNMEAKESSLYIFCDGPKGNATDKVRQEILEVRLLAKNENRFKNVIVTEYEENRGLADSVVNAVSDIVNLYGKVIVLEDDIITSPLFLKYMNDSLTLYEFDDRVYHISGYMFPVKKRLPSTFFYNTASCWGWGTWRRAWDSFNDDAGYLLNEIQKMNLVSSFDIENSYNFFNDLTMNADGRLKTWAVKWYASFFIKNGFSLHPYPSFTNNIGHDGMGENCVQSDQFNWYKLSNTYVSRKIDIVENKDARTAMREFYRNTSGKKLPMSLKVKMTTKNLLKKILPAFLLDRLKEFRNRELKMQKAQENSMLEIREIPRYNLSQTDILGFNLQFVDSASFVFMYEEIFKKCIYKFESSSSDPFIIDCGANIGLSLIYFKQLFPASRIIAFEPDKEIYKTLSFNCNSFGLSNIELIPKACWNEVTTLEFLSEGADGGRTAVAEDGKANVVQVETIRLRDYIDRTVDFLKIDIEGAEFTVLNDIADKLHHVQKLFVEYHSFTGQEQWLPEIVAILKSAGFRLYVSAPGLSSLNPFIHINTYAGMDGQLNIYAAR